MTAAAPLPVGSRTAARFAWQLPTALGLAVLVLAVTGPTPLAAPGVALAAIAPELARVDAREHRLPNRMTLPAIALGTASVAASALAGGPWIVPAVAGLAFGGGMLALSLAGGVGMGDAKLAAVIGLASPSAAVAIGAPLLGLLLGGVAGTVALLRAGPRRRIPLGPFLVLGWALALAIPPALTAAS